MTSCHTSRLPPSLISLYKQISSTLIQRREMCPSGKNSGPETGGTTDFRQAFEVLDTDQDGKISQDDLRSFYTGFCSSNTTQEDIDSMIAIADSNKDGFVEFDEFANVLGCRRTSPPRNGLMEEVFGIIDRDGDGKVGFDDLTSYMNWAGFATTDEDIKAMIQMGGGDEKEGVSYEGLLKILAVDFHGATGYL